MVTDQNVAVVREKVARYLTELTQSGYATTPSGQLTARSGSTQLFIGCGELRAGLTRVTISAPVLLGVAPSWELFRYIALLGDRYPFGRVIVRNSAEPDLLELMYEQSLVGEHLDKVEFDVAVSVVCHAADELDSEMQAQFGGRRMHEDAPGHRHSNAMRLRQGTNPYVGSFKVGVCNVYEPSDRPGTVVAQLSMFDPSTGEVEDVVVTAGDEIALGAQRYLVVAVVVELGSGQRDWVEIAAIDGAAPA